MKEIITSKGTLALKPETNIDISKNNPLFTKAEEFSIDLAIPRKPNDAIFSHKYRMATSGAVNTMDVSFKFKGREKLRGSVDLLSASDDEYGVLLKGNRSVFLFNFGKQKLREIDFDWEYFVPGVTDPTIEQVIAEAKNTLTLGRDWICFPVYTGEQNYAPMKNAWDFNQDTFLNPETTAWSSIVPFMRLHRAIERLFAFYGYTIADTDNWFKATYERQCIVIYTNQSLASLTMIEIKWMYPDWTIEDFISNLEDFFPVTFLIDHASKTVKIISDDTMTTDPPSGKLDNYISGKPRIIFNDTVSGYKLEYDYPEDDASITDLADFKDLIQGTWEVNTFADLPTATGNNYAILVLAEGQYYAEEKNENDVWVWRKKGSVAISVRDGDEQIERKTKIYPLMNTVGDLEVYIDFVKTGEANVPCLTQLVIQVPAIDKSFVTVMEDFRLMVYRGMQSITYYSPSSEELIGYAIKYPPRYPMANFVNRKINADRWSSQTLELRWDGDMGLRGADTIAFLDGAERIEAKLVIHHTDLEKLDITKVYTLGGRKVIISEMVVHYGESSKVEVDVVLLAAV